MTAPRVRADYDNLKQVAASFASQAQAARQTIQSLQSQMDVLQGGDWIGQGASAFYQEMGSQVLPTLKRLAAALENATQTTLQIVQVIHQAEDDAAALFKGSGAGGVGAAGGAALGAMVGAAPAGPSAAETAGALAGAALGAVLTGGLGAAAGAPKGVTPQQAQQMFKSMANQGDIAFNYPNDGCYARAYLMNERLEQQYGVTPSRVWAFGNLSVPTSGPYGQVNWGYHVASAIPVTQPDGSTQMMVIDPSIESGPVTVDQWAKTMGTTAASTQVTPMGTPPTNPATGKPFPGTGYWPGADPTRFGGPQGYSNEVMRRYKQCGNAGAQCNFVPAG